MGIISTEKKSEGKIMPCSGERGTLGYKPTWVSSSF